MSTPQPPPVTATTILAALDATKAEITATKAEITALRGDMEADRVASQQRDDRLTRYGRNNRRYIAVDVLLTIVATALTFLSVHAIQSAAQANSAQLALCQAGNVSRAQQRQLWDHLISLPPAPGTPKRTPAQIEQLNEFRAYVDSVFTPRNCSSLGRK